MNRALLSLVFFTTLSILQGADVDPTEKKAPGGTVEQVEESRRGTWRPRERTVGWGANKRGGAMRIKDGDRKKPARARPEWIKWRKGKGAGRAYRNASDEEYHSRIFEESEAMVAENQAAFATGEASYELELNKFADYSEEEIAHLGIGEAGRRAALEYSSKFNETERYANDESNNINRPKRSTVIVDWRARGKVPPVKNQGQCGSCYVFSVVATIEAHIRIKYNISVDLSEQQVVDCSYGYGGNFGCNGGWMPDVYKYIMEMTGGLVTEKEYPYKAMRNSCPALPLGFPLSKVLAYALVPSSENSLLDVLTRVGPVSVAIVAGLNDFQLYKQGIYNNPTCYERNNDHAVLLVGAGIADGADYWIIRNSWGTNWGENGDMRLMRGVDMCKVNWYSTYPIM